MASKPIEVTEERVTVFVPKMPGEDPTVFVGINGKNYLIPRGKRTEVPRNVADVLRMAEEQADRAQAYEDQQREKMSIIQGAPM